LKSRHPWFDEDMVFRWETRIRFIDTDASGRIHYTALFRYFESAELEFFREIGALHEHPTTAFPRVHVECDYSGAIIYDDLLTIELSIGKIGNSSARFEFLVLKDDKEAAKGVVVIACIDRETQRAVPIPENIREKLLPYVRA
jgi:YbgC/YbaW family acyl-CoA thioester hydrolase